MGSAAGTVRELRVLLLQQPFPIRRFESHESQPGGFRQ
jgi:hypothetical protein